MVTVAPTNRCRDCNRQRWNELHAKKRAIRDDERRLQIARLLWFLIEASWRTGKRRRVVRIARPTGRPRTPIDLARLDKCSRKFYPSVRAAARDLGIHWNTLNYRLKVDGQIGKQIRIIRLEKKRTLAPLYAPNIDIWTLAPDQMERLIDRAIPAFTLPLDRADVRQEILCAVLSGEIELQNLLREMPQVLRRMKAKYQTAFFSIDTIQNPEYKNGMSVADHIPSHVV